MLLIYLAKEFQCMQHLFLNIISAFHKYRCTKITRIILGGHDNRDIIFHNVAILFCV